MSYVSSNANRFYTALEASYGAVGTITSANRIPALKLTVQSQLDMKDRKDKTGSRTFAGLPAGGRRKTNFELHTYLTSWQKSTVGNPGYGPMFQAALGGTPQHFTGGTVASATGAGRLGFAVPHGLSAGQAVVSNGEIRFVAAIVDANNVQLNAPFTVVPAAGATVGSAITYVPATMLPSATIFDYWDPSTAVQRVLCGAAVDQMEILLNGDYHEVHFKGLARDVLDSSSFSSSGGSIGQLSSFPAEPAVAAFDFSVVPGNLGQAWLGTSPTQFFTITTASIVVKNAIETRSREFGSSFPRAICPGQRSVTAAFDLYSQDDSATTALYQAARQRSPISVMLQLGELEGQVMGVYMTSVIPEVPEFDDSEQRLQWHFRSSRAQGTVDNEITVAFG
jgi:hypothetical protein